MWHYAVIFATGLAVDLIPVFAPPAWTIIVLMVMKWRVNVWLAAFVCAAGSTIGRYSLCCYMPFLSRRYLNGRENGNIAFLGKKLGGRFAPTFAFVFLYCLTPLSTTALFTAAGVARVNVLPILPAFFVGKAVGDGIYIVSSRNAIRSVHDIMKGQGSPKGLIMTAVAVLLLSAMLFVDWRQLLEHKTLRLEFRIWKKR
jgi:membrane protein YqaA with SNARE-associated domain